MKFITLSGKSICCDLDIDHYKFRCDSTSKSKIQKDLGLQLIQKYPNDTVLQDFPIPGMNGLHLDFYIPSRSLAYECNGQQHYKFVRRFHGTLKGFINQKERDDIKRRWCLANGIVLETVRFDGLEEYNND